jgi:hypothetical protein
MSEAAKYFTKREAAAYLSLGVSTLDRLRVTGRGPAYSRPVRKIIYRSEDLDAWVKAHMRQSTAENTVAA